MKLRIVDGNETKHPKSLATLGLLYVSVNLGTVVQIAGLNISYLFSIIFIATYLYENNMKIIINSGKDRRIVSLFIFWIIYAFAQIVVVKDFTLYKSFYLIMVINTFIFIATLFVVTNKYELIFVIRVATFCIWMNIIAAGWEYYTGSILVDEKYILAERQYIAGFIGNFNDFCTFMYLGCVLFLLQLYFSEKFIERVYCVLGIIFAVIIIFFDAARGAIFAVDCFAICFILLLLANSKNVSKQATKIIIVILALFVLLTIILVIRENGIYGALALLDRSGGGDIGSDRGRLKLIISCLDATANTLGFGVGAGQSILVCGGINVHNFYIEILCEYGILVCIFVIYLSFVVPMKRDISESSYVNAVTQSFAITFIVAAVTSSSINKMRMLWIVIVIIYILKEKVYGNSLVSYER